VSASMARIRPPMLARLAVLACCLGPTVAALSVGGCGGVGGSVRMESAPGTVQRGETARILKPALATLVYHAPDSQTADIYLTDLHPDELDPRNDLSGVSGQLVHLNMFLVPRAGSTPIEKTAVTAVIRHVVIARGQVGVYGGGGFMFTRGSPGDSSFGGSVDRATMRLLARTGGFVDLLGPTEFSGSFLARLDKPSADLLARRFRDLVATARAATP